VERAAMLMLDEAAAYLRGNTKLERVIFCLYDTTTLHAFEKAFNNL
jgi:O-acetyl-ADP-ribose deacetylase (regulator of RNase III)